MANPTADQIDEAVNRRLAYLEFWEFCLYYDYEFFIKRPFLKEVADAFQYLYEQRIAGNSTRIAVSMPPRAGKSYITSLFCAWFLGKLPKLCVMRNSCTATLYQKLSRHVRNMVKSDAYRRVFPEIKLSVDNQALDGWALDTSRNGAYFGGGIDGTIIGSGADLSINDDLYRSLADALSPGYNEKVLEWKEGTADSRKEKNCSEIYIGTRWRKGDVIGVAIEKGKIERNIVIAALTPDNKSFCEDVRSTAEYLETKKDIAKAIWDAEYMQDPTSPEGLMFPEEALNYYNPETVHPEELSEYRAGFCDPADEGGDSLSFPAGYLVENKVYIHDVIYNTKGTDINEPKCVEFIQAHELNAIEIESNSAWTIFRKNVKRLAEEAGSICEIKSRNSTTNKHTRILAASAFIRNHFVFRSDWKTGSDDYRRFMENLTSYMEVQAGTAKNKHDDAPDSCAGLAKFIRTVMAHVWATKQ